MDPPTPRTIRTPKYFITGFLGFGSPMRGHRATFVKKTCDKVLRSPNPPGGWGGVPQILAKLGNFGFLSETWGNRDSLAKVTKEILNEG